MAEYRDYLTVKSMSQYFVRSIAQSVFSGSTERPCLAILCAVVGRYGGERWMSNLEREGKPAWLSELRYLNVIRICT